MRLSGLSTAHEGAIDMFPDSADPAGLDNRSEIHYSVEIRVRLRPFEVVASSPVITPAVAVSLEPILSQMVRKGVLEVHNLQRDPVKDFLSDCCVVGEKLFVSGAEIARIYALWDRRNREGFLLGPVALRRHLRDKGFGQRRSRRIGGKQARTWEGLAIRGDIAARLLANRGENGVE